MTASRLFARARREDDGGVLVQVAFWMPVLILFMSFAIDMGNWWVHKRHLQMQADASALAAATEFAYPCSDSLIETRAISYAGRDYNAQIGGTPGDVKFGDQVGPANERGVHMLINSQRWPLQNGADDPIDTTVDTATPCDARMVDVKLTETAVPWFFRLANVDFINAHARVSILKRKQTNKLFPIAAPDVDPKRIKVKFVNEETGAVVGSSELQRIDSDEDENPNATWSNLTAELAEVSVTGERIGMRVHLSDTEADVIDDCAHQLVQCVDVDSAGGIARIRGWAQGSTTPVVRDVQLTTGTCDPYFAPIANDSTTCSVGVEADIDFGGDPTTLGAEVWAAPDGAKNKEVRMVYNGTKWVAESPVVVSDSGPTPITMRWKKSCRGCSGDFPGEAHSQFIADELRSGPIQSVRINEIRDDNLQELWPGNSFRQCTETFTDCTKELAVTLELTGTFKDARSATDKFDTIPMRVMGNGGNNKSQSTALSCTSSTDGGPDQLKKDLAVGCLDGYTRNTGETCPTNAAGLDAMAQPWPCVALALGATPNSIAAGLNCRILVIPTGVDPDSCQGRADSCTSPNRWGDYWEDSDGDGQEEFKRELLQQNNDPRLVEMIVVPKWTLTGGSGQETVPIKRFAYFYITGWRGEGGGFSNPCQTYTAQLDDPAGEGQIVGHFVDYLESVPTSSTELCNLAEIQSCTTQMTI